MESTALIVSIVSVIGAVAAAFFTYRRDASGIAADVIDTYKERVSQLEDRVKTCEGLHRENLKRTGELEGVVHTLERVLENRDPKLEKNLEGILLFMERIEKHMQAEHPIS